MKNPHAKSYRISTLTGLCCRVRRNGFIAAPLGGNERRPDFDLSFPPPRTCANQKPTLRVLSIFSGIISASEERSAHRGTVAESPCRLCRSRSTRSGLFVAARAEYRSRSIGSLSFSEQAPAGLAQRRIALGPSPSTSSPGQRNRSTLPRWKSGKSGHLSKKLADYRLFRQTPVCPKCRENIQEGHRQRRFLVSRRSY